MGGYGSGTWRASRRPLAETMRRIDLATIRREEPSLTARHVLRIQCHRDDGENVEVANVHLESTRMYFGGRRLWFRCPRCDGRCRVLYAWVKVKTVAWREVNLERWRLFERRKASAIRDGHQP